MAKPQLFLLHFAGGNGYSFQFMNPFLKKFDVLPIELPGRGKRIQEALLKDFEQAAEDIYNQILSNTSSAPFLIYGHSMGAYLGLRVSFMLQEAGKAPNYLIVSGNTGPGLKEDKPDKIYLLQEEDFIERLMKLGGIPKEIAENKEIFRFFEPVIRADFEIIEKNSFKEQPAIKNPIYAIIGNREKFVDRITNWSKYTKSNFDYTILEGGHFFIYEHAEKVASVITECYDRILKE